MKNLSLITNCLYLKQDPLDMMVGWWILQWFFSRVNISHENRNFSITDSKLFQKIFSKINQKIWIFVFFVFSPLKSGHFAHDLSKLFCKKTLNSETIPPPKFWDKEKYLPLFFFEDGSYFNCINGENKWLEVGSSYTIVCTKNGGEYFKPKTNHQIKCSEFFFYFSIRCNRLE